jgi:hypothetical protein
MSSFEALVRFAPATSLGRINDPKWHDGAHDRLMYDASGLRLIREPVPLLVDHRDDQAIGSVRQLLRLDSDGPWVVAVATVTKPPPWLKRGTPASFAHICPVRSSFGDPILRSGLVTEVSLLSPGVEPAEPLAQVVVLKRTAPPTPGVEIASGDRARRHHDTAPRAITLPPGGIIYRPNIGQITTVR